MTEGKKPAKKKAVSKPTTSTKGSAQKPTKKAALKIKTKAVTAEIVDDNKLKFKDVSNKSTPVEVFTESDEQSPLDIAAERAEAAYSENHDEDFDFDVEEPQVEERTTGSSNSKAVAIAPSHLPKTTDPLVLYLNEIRKYPLLTREKEKEISEKYFETKDPEAAQLLVRSNLRFVVKIAAEYSKFGAKLIDLIQEGNVGLMHAVREFNPYKGARLITYAVWWIRGYIQEYLMRQYSMVRIGTTQNQRKLFYQLQKEKNNLEALSNEQNLHELSERLGIPEEEIKIMAQRLSGRDVSLDRPVDGDDSPTLSAFQQSSTESMEDTLAREEMIKLLQSKVSELEPGLSEREKIILHERLLNEEPLTLQEIGEKYGITREAVRQMEARLIKKIKDKFGDLN
ncbi:MAG: RNA polymerase factor sigma-32 [Bdellovibrionaceae bacterium]|nr:RNA polymerase factor sigma-32 [Pseudobdellovibrionaceae bacterium]